MMPSKKKKSSSAGASAVGTTSQNSWPKYCQKVKGVSMTRISSARSGPPRMSYVSPNSSACSSISAITSSRWSRSWRCVSARLARHAGSVPTLSMNSM